MRDKRNSAKSSHPDPTYVQRKIENAYDYSRNGQNGCGNVGVHKLVQVMEQKPSLVRLDARLGFEPVLKHSQRTRPGEQFGKNAPDKRGDVQPAKRGARARHKGAEDYPHNEQRRQKEDENGKRRIDGRGRKHS